jgi:Ras-related protein Rab-2A
VYTIGACRPVQSWLCEVREYANANVSVLLVGNKCDLAAKRMVTTREAKKLADENNCVDYIETSAKTGDQVNDAFVTVTRLVPTTYRVGYIQLHF